MVNKFAGEVALEINKTQVVAKLTLGALAELEDTLAAGSLIALIERFEQRNFTTRDVLAVLVAGLRGGGWQGDARTVADADIGGGALEAARVAALLLTRAFAVPAP